MAAVQSAVRLPTPPPPDSVPASSGKRKRSPSSRSPSPDRRRSPPHPTGANGQADDEDETNYRGRGFRGHFGMRPKEAEPEKEPTAEEKLAAAKAEYDKLLNSRAGGVYVPPARLRALEAQLVQDKSSKEYQRIAWEALKKSLQGLVNKATAANIKLIVPELFGENLIRGKGLFCRAIMRAQAASLPFTPVYAAMVAIVNTKIPEIGELLLHRLVSQFKKAFRRNDKAVCLASTTFIGGLFNQQVAHEIIIAEIMLLLLQKPTDDSVEIAVGLMREVGEHLTEMNGQIAMVCFDRFRTILHEHDLDKRVQYMIEVLFQIRKDKWKNHEAIKEELDLVEDEDQITHTEIHLDQEHETKDSLNVFRFDPEFEDNEEAYKKLKAEILGEDSGSEEGDSEDDESSEDDENEEEKKMEIQDQSNAELVQLRKRIYLVIQSSADYEECCHKLMRINLPAGLEPELPSMVIECCSQATTYIKFYGLIGERLSRLNRLWQGLFEEAFDKYYGTIHRYETNKLRNIARFFGHMLGSDALGWHVLHSIQLNEDDTTSSSRIFIKILFQDLQEALGLPKLVARLRDFDADPTMQPALGGLFPRDNPRNMRFAINYFTSIGLGALTEDLRTRLAALPKPAPPAALPAGAARGASPSGSDSYSTYSSSYSYTGSSRSYSRSRSPAPRRGGVSPRRAAASPRHDARRRGRSSSRSASTRSRSASLSPSPSPPRRSARDHRPPQRHRRGREYTPSTGSSRSRTPPPRHSRASPERSRDGPERRREADTQARPSRGRRRYEDSSPSRSPSSPPPPRNRRRRSYSSASASRSPPPARRRASPSGSRSPPRRR